MSALTYAIIDLDDVVYPFISRFTEFSATELKKHPSEFPVPSAWGFHTSWGWSAEEFAGMLAKGVKDSDLFWEGTPLPCSLEGWRDVRAAVDVIHVVTARTCEGAEREAAEATVHWLHHHGFTYDQLSISRDKVTEVQRDLPAGAQVFCVDDGPHNFAAYEDAGFTSVLFDAPWNQEVDARHRVNSLSQFAKVIESANLARSVSVLEDTA